MLRFVTIFTLILSATPTLAIAACEATPTEFLPPLSISAQANRAKIFTELCEGKAPLIDINDSRLSGRATLADDKYRLDKMVTTFLELKPQSLLQIDVIMVVEIDAKGIISSVALLETTGDKQVDRAATWALKSVRKFGVYKLDDKPVRAFVNYRFRFGQI